MGSWARRRREEVVAVWREGTAAARGPVAPADGAIPPPLCTSWPLLGLVVLVGGSGALLKGLAVLEVVEGWSHAAAAALTTGAAVLVACLVVRGAASDDGPWCGVRARLAALGLLPRPVVVWSRPVLVRTALTAGAVLLPMLGLGPVADPVRVVSVIVGLGALAALWRAGRPGLGLRWVALPVGLVAPAVAVAQLGRGTGGATWSDVADLCFVVVAAEELVFRGALLAISLRAFRPSSSVWPAAVVSALFALWHVGDALGDTAGSAWWWRVLVVVLTLVGTWAFGMACTWLRYRTRTLAGPAGLHLSTNVFRLA